MAARAGVRLGMRRGGVLTMAPQTLIFDRAPQREAEGLRRAATALLQFSPNVVEAEEACVLVDVSASLRLFGGIRKLVRHVRATARALGVTPVTGCAPTAQGAWLLARAGPPAVLWLAPAPCIATRAHRGGLVGGRPGDPRLLRRRG
ncbi:Y-family DNA polymerase [Cupriavidus necator]